MKTQILALSGSLAQALRLCGRVFGACDGIAHGSIGFGRVGVSCVYSILRDVLCKRRVLAYAYLLLRACLVIAVVASGREKCIDCCCFSPQKTKAEVAGMKIPARLQCQR